MMYRAGGSATPAALSRSSKVTPCHVVSSFDQPDLRYFNQPQQ